MANLFALVEQLPASIKAGWILWMGWGAVQVMWYRRARVMVLVPQPSPQPRISPRRVDAAARPDSTPRRTPVKAAAVTAVAPWPSDGLEATPPHADAPRFDVGDLPVIDLSTLPVRESILGLAD